MCKVLQTCGAVTSVSLSHYSPHSIRSLSIGIFDVSTLNPNLNPKPKPKPKPFLMQHLNSYNDFLRPAPPIFSKIILEVA